MQQHQSQPGVDIDVCRMIGCAVSVPWQYVKTQDLELVNMESVAVY